MENKYEKALYIIGLCYVCSESKYLMESELYGKEWDTLKELVDKQKELENLKEENTKYKTLAQELGCPLENVMALFQVCKNKKYYFKFDDKIYECDNAYVNNIYWNKSTNEAFISVNTNNKELEKKGAYDVMLFANDYGKTWWLEKPEEEK